MENQTPIKNKLYEILIDGMTHEGEGVGRIGSMAVFVEGALKGEKVRAQVLKVSKNHALAKMVKVIEPSSQRITPQCPHAEQCGGCGLLHMSYAGQLEFKTQKVKDALNRIGHIDAEVLNTLGMPDPWKYRNKAQYPFGEAGGTIVHGFYEKGSHKIVPVSGCLIQPTASDDSAKIVEHWMTRYGIEPYDEKTQTGIVRHVITRVSRKSGEVMVILVANAKAIPKADELVKILRENVHVFKSLVLNVNTKNTNVIMGRENKAIFGELYIYDNIGDVTFRLSPNSFFQVNPVQVEVLYDKALEYSEITGKETVIDAYCGIGSITLFLAKKAKKVYGIEIVPEAVKDARHNAKINNIDNAEFLEGQAEKIMPKLAAQGIKPDVVVVDPPRKGCDEALLKAIIDMAPKRVVYVSCNPSTLARDLRYLEDRGYKTGEVQPVDMFPHTPHVETVVLLSHKNADSFISVKMDYADDIERVPDRVTYKLIQDYIEDKYNFKVHTAYIAEVKRSLGLPMNDAPNAVEELKHPYKQAPAYKVEAIKDALKHFNVI